MDKQDTYNITLKWQNALKELLKNNASLTLTERNAIEFAIELYNI